MQTPSGLTWDKQVLTQLGFNESEASTFANFAEYRPGASARITARRRRVGRSTHALIKNFTLECTFEALIPRG
jgi:hypothetical protein